MPDLELPHFSAGLVIADPKTGKPTHAFFQYWQRFKGQIEESINSVAAAQAAADAANAAAAAADTAADNAQTAADDAASAADDVTAASNLANSYVTNFTPPLFDAASTGDVTIANHDRVYGDGTTVSITGGVVSTGEANPAYVYINYTDATRADTTPTFTFSTDEASAAQIGDNHHVGAGQIPLAGSAAGGYPRPPGYGGVIP